jgi:hypothetical protein
MLYDVEARQLLLSDPLSWPASISLPLALSQIRAFASGPGVASQTAHRSARIHDSANPPPGPSLLQCPFRQTRIQDMAQAATTVCDW